MLIDDPDQRPTMDQVAFHPWLQTDSPRSIQNLPQYSHVPEVYGKTFGQLPFISDREELVKVMAEKGYPIQFLIGKGAYGAVYRGSKLDLRTLKRTPVALKVVGGFNKRAQKENLMSHRFRTELKVMETFEHPNLVTIYDVFREKTRPHLKHTMEKRVFIFMELADSDLARVIQVRKFITEQDLKPIIRQVLKGLGYLHAMKVAHRDVKPANILIFPNNVAKLTDYSFVREVSSTPISITGVGTPGYRAPEILLENKTLGNIFKVDIWALGITIYECLMGQLPDWEPEYAARQGRERKRLPTGENPAPFRKEYNELMAEVLDCQKSDEVTTLMHSMLQFDPNSRPAADGALNNQWFQGVSTPAKSDFHDDYSPVKSSPPGQSI